MESICCLRCFFFQAEDGIRDADVTWSSDVCSSDLYCRRTLVSNVIPSVVSVKTSKKIAVRRQYALDPFEFFFRNPRQFRNPNEEAMVQNSLEIGRASCRERGKDSSVCATRIE